MTHRPYPDRNRALHQVCRHHRPYRPIPDLTITITADATKLSQGLLRAQSAGVFATHPDLFPGS